MGLLSIFFIGLGLAMDAFAVAITVGINTNKNDRLKMAIKVGLFFGGFQALMPLLGWMLGIRFTSYITPISDWISFMLLAIIGGKMLYEGIKNDDDNEEKEYSNKALTLLAIATSIDALAVGVSFAFLNINIVYAIIIIGIVTFILSIIAIYIGKILGSVFKSKAEILGGLILIAISLKIIIQHFI